MADAPGYYTMRAGQTAAVTAFWATVDELALHRRRHVMHPADLPLPQPLHPASSQLLQDDPR